MKHQQSSKKRPTIEEAVRMVNYGNQIVPPVKRNGLVCENESMLYKIQALINCPKYEAFQTEFYDLDPDNISPELEEKINKMYRKAVASGDITGTEDGEERVTTEEEMQFGSDDDEDEENNQVDDYVNPYRDENYREPYEYTGQVVGDLNLNEIPASGPVTNTFTCLYTALDREGGYKTGKFYSNANSADTARIDAVSKLAAFGYKNIEIAAVETGTISPSQIANNEAGDDIAQLPPDEQIQSEEPSDENGEGDIPSTSLAELGDDEKLQMFSDWFQAFKSTLWDMDSESLAQLDDERKKEFWTRLKTKTVEMPQDPRTFINKATMDKLEQGTFPQSVEPEMPVTGETADDDADVQAALNGEVPPAGEEGTEGPGESGNEPVFAGGEENGAAATTAPEQAGGEVAPEPQPAAPAEPTAQPAAPQPTAQPANPEGNEEEGEEVVTEDEDDDDEIDWFNLPDDWAESPDDYDDDFDIRAYLAANPVDIDNGEPEEDVVDVVDGDVLDYEPTVEPPEEEPLEDGYFDETPRRCFYNTVREKNPYNGDGPFAEEDDI